MPGEVVFTDGEEENGGVLKPLAKLAGMIKKGSKYALGIFLIVCVALIWVFSSVLIQYIFGELQFNKPYFLTYFNTTGFSLWNLGFFLFPAWERVPFDDDRVEQPLLVEDPRLLHDGWHEEEERARQQQQHRLPASRASRNGTRGAGSQGGVMHTEEVANTAVLDELREYSLPPSASSSFCSTSSVEDFYDVAVTVNVQQRVRVERLRKYSRMKIWKAAAFFCPFWFFANYLFNLSLSRTSVASNTILSSTSSIWTVLLSYVWLRQPVGILKWLGVILCFTGSILVGVSSKEGRDTVGGDIAALISAFFYATYTTILKFFLPDDARYSMPMVFGAVGVINFIFLWPGLVFLHLTRWEVFLMPTFTQFIPLALNSLIGTNLSDVLWARSVILTSPVVATLGLSLTIPLSMVVDAVLSDAHFGGKYIAGAVLVLCGFICASLPFHVDIIRIIKDWKS
ncbi:solute carrier family 35, member F5 [Angomonas deanei]|uniref:Triose-phosphate Transporter family/Solute carrier family 35/EamA-like transporter family, putative n=1 Tax=Angomonas deanei TaxID=59799 RepID=A0A7G2CQL4_9TRYP|nr:solute carrier family 35, member F5 [Angomonas deanei]CAD2222126.1 Triose-phosphate Transporter family/Solute carrier family 35/EamA-like transporter family, putative [Angomonas deanei]|eukprot:EPY30037.1 solute carrier family 35, member F5 [Angomonas deanei]